MIKYRCSPSAKFIESYEREILARTQARMVEFLKLVPEPFTWTYRKFFDNYTMKRILLCPAEDLVAIIHKIYSEFPELADRYWVAYLLAGIAVPVEISNYGVRSVNEKEVLDRLCDRAADFLASSRFKSCVYISFLKSSLSNAEKYSDKRKVLSLIAKAASGDIRASEDYLAMFPAWVNDFESIFSYPELSKKIGHKIIEEWGIDICLYCNNEDIQSRGVRVVYRTDLDHFYPKSKFPFLAVSLSNLVPAGKTCNQSYKQDRDMLDFAHPFACGVAESALFFLEYPMGGKVTEDNYSVKLFPQGGSIDRSLDVFEIAHLYSNSNEIRGWVASTFSLMEWAVGINSGEIPQQVINQIIDVTKPSHAVRAKKFKVDTVNQFFGKPVLNFF
jgi:hypothetical protein